MRADSAVRGRVDGPARTCRPRCAHSTESFSTACSSPVRLRASAACRAPRRSAALPRRPCPIGEPGPVRGRRRPRRPAAVPPPGGPDGGVDPPGTPARERASARTTRPASIAAASAGPPSRYEHAAAARAMLSGARAANTAKSRTHPPARAGARGSRTGSRTAARDRVVTLGPAVAPVGRRRPNLHVVPEPGELARQLGRVHGPGCRPAAAPRSPCAGSRRSRTVGASGRRGA